MISCDIGLVKPQREIFDLVLEKLNLKASDCIFIDDREKHLAMPKEMGFQVIHFKSNQQLKNDLKTANQVLYIGDNCGEIVLDKLFIQTINHPNIYFAVRGGPVINDVTIEDAKMVGIDKITKIITTGDDSPGAVWETCSNKFKNIFKKSDIVIAKGQGNLEGLLDVKHNIYFLFVVKCNLIGSRVGAKVGDFIIKNHN